MTLKITLNDLEGLRSLCHYDGGNHKNRKGLKCPPPPLSLGEIGLIDILKKNFKDAASNPLLMHAWIIP